LDRVKGHDPEAWRRVVELYGPFVYSWCRRWDIEPSAAADVVQEVFQRAAGAIDRFRRDGAGTTFRGWLWTIARNQARDYFAARAKRPEAVGGTDFQARLAQLSAPLDERSGDAASPPDEAAACMRRAVDLIRSDFQPQTWLVFWRTTIDRQSSSEVAAELGISKGAVRQAKHRVLERLREQFAELLG